MTEARDPTTEALVERARGGDPAAFEDLVGRYGERLLRQIRARMGRRVGSLFANASLRQDLNNYLESLGPDAPMHSVEEIIASKRYLPCLDSTFFGPMRQDRPPEADPEYPQIEALESELREALLEALTTNDLDATFLGPPDGAREGLGNQSVTYDLAPAVVTDGPGPDLNVYEGTREGALLDPESSSIDVLVSADGEEFLSVKGSEGLLVHLWSDEAHGQDRLARSYDRGPSGLASARYIRIQGLGDEPAGEGRGFDLDAVGVLHLALCPPPPPEFRRGDANADGVTDISDAIAILGFLFLGSTMNDCKDAADVNHDSKVDISDPVRLLGHLFLGSERPPEPSVTCGDDPTTDDLDCNTVGKCP